MTDSAMHEVLPGIWHWTAFHEGIQNPVSSYYVEPARALIDPMLPPDGGPGWFAARGVDRILLTNRHHLRHSERLAQPLGCPVLCHEAGLHEFEGGPYVVGFRWGDEVAPGIVAHEVGALCPEETALHVTHGAGAMSFADAVVNWPDRGLGFVPDRYMGDDPEAVKQGLIASLRRLAELPFEALLVGHGNPIASGGRAALAGFVDAWPGPRG